MATDFLAAAAALRCAPEPFGAAAKWNLHVQQQCITGGWGGSGPPWGLSRGAGLSPARGSVGFLTDFLPCPRLQKEMQLAQKADYLANNLPDPPSYDKLSVSPPSCTPLCQPWARRGPSGSPTAP